MQVKKKQQRIEMILSNNYKGTEVEYVDVAASEDAKAKMRELSGNPKAVPPQFFNGDVYCGVSECQDNYDCVSRPMSCTRQLCC